MLLSNVLQWFAILPTSHGGRNFEDRLWPNTAHFSSPWQSPLARGRFHHLAELPFSTGVRQVKAARAA